MQNKATSPLSPPLAAAIAACYDAFNHYRAPTVLDVCLECCVEPETEEQLRRLPLRQLTRELLYEYNDSAKSQVQNAAEVGYFLPRMLELIAQGESVHHSAPLYLDRLGGCPRGDFSPAQWHAVQAVVQALFDECLGHYPWESDALRIGYDLFEVLLMGHIGGLDIQPLLDTWQRTDTPQATLQYADSAWFGYWAEGRISSPFADNQPEYRAQMEAWLRSEEHRITFARRLMALDTARIPGFQDWQCCAHFPPAQLIEYLTDFMSQGLSDQALRQILN